MEDSRAPDDPPRLPVVRTPPGEASDPVDRAVLATLVLAFAPVHKAALGGAVGITLGALVLTLTAYHLLAQPEPAPDLRLLNQYFFGYAVSWPGAFIGGFWAAVVGYVAGWFLAFLRNLSAATILFMIRTRAELEQTRDFLDHI